MIIIRERISNVSRLMLESSSVFAFNWTKTKTEVEKSRNVYLVTNTDVVSLSLYLKQKLLTH